MAICSRCGNGFDLEHRRRCPHCGQLSTGRPYGYPAGKGPLLSLLVPFLCGVGLAILLTPLDSLRASFLLATVDGLLLGFLFAVLGFYLWSIRWAYLDAQARGKSAFWVAMLVFSLGPTGLIIWLAFRP